MEVVHRHRCSRHPHRLDRRHGANCNDVRLLGPTLEEVEGRGLLAEVGTLWLDRGYDGVPTRHGLRTRDRRRQSHQATQGQATTAGPTKDPMGLRWPVERTNSWLSNYGQMRRNTDRTMQPPTGSARPGHCPDHHGQS